MFLKEEDKDSTTETVDTFDDLSLELTVSLWDDNETVSRFFFLSCLTTFYFENCLRLESVFEVYKP